VRQGPRSCAGGAGRLGGVSTRVWKCCVWIGLAAVLVGLVDLVVREPKAWSSMYTIDGEITHDPNQAVTVACYGNPAGPPVALVAGSALTLLGCILRLVGPAGRAPWGRRRPPAPARNSPAGAPSDRSKGI